MMPFRRPTEENPEPVPARLGRWQARIFALCWTGYFLTYFGRMNLSVALGALEAQFASGKAAVGLLGSLFYWVYAVGKLINGYRGDKADNRLQIFIGLAVSGLCNLMAGLCGQLWVLMLLWGLNGFAQSALWCNILHLVSNWFFPRQHPGAIVWLSTSMVGGALASWGVCGWLIDRLPWQWVFRLPGLTLLGFSAVWLLLSKNRAADAGFDDVCQQPSAGGAQKHAQQPLRAFLAQAALLPVVAACLAQGVVKDGIGLWGPDMVSGAYGLNTGTASFLLLFIPVMKFFGITLAGVLQSRFHLSDTDAAVAMMVMAAVCIGGLQLCLGRSLGWGVAWLGGASAVMYGVNTIMLSVFPMRFAPSGRISFVSGVLDFSSYMAAGVSGVFAGFVLDRGLGWPTVFLVWQGLTLMGLLALLWIRWRER